MFLWKIKQALKLLILSKSFIIVSEFYNSSMKLWLKGNDIEIYLTQNENLLLVKDFLEPYDIVMFVVKISINTWLQYRKVWILLN